MKSLQKSIDGEQQQIAELQQMWLRDQSELVRLCHEEETLSEAVETLKKELTVLTQKKLRIEGRTQSVERLRKGRLACACTSVKTLFRCIVLKYGVWGLSGRFGALRPKSRTLQIPPN